MTTAKINSAWPSYLLGLCILVGFLLRIGNPTDWSFINDELSTWAKVSYDSLGGVIDNIRAEDSHPVGMYVLVYFWTSLFGTAEWVIKLPFLLMSLCSLYFVYRLAVLWFHKNAALVVVAFVASLQFPIWWSMIARQYQSGLFLTLLMAYCWTKLVWEKEQTWQYWLGFVLAGAAAMYNHYFSLIFAAVIGASGFLFLPLREWGRYALAGIIMVGLFAPHAEITWYQMTHADGHLWYNRPSPSFLTNHIYYLFHYSYLALLLPISLLVMGALAARQIPWKTQWKRQALALVWFLTPLLFGYFYSVYVSPILRTSHLLFSFPYLLFFLAAFVPKEWGFAKMTGIILVILGVNSYTLIADRQHYQTIHTHPYEHFIRHTKDFLSQHEHSGVSIVLGENPRYLQYYKDAYETDFEHHPSFKPHLSIQEFKAILENSVTSYLIIGSLPEVYVQIALEYYPYLLKESYGINYEYYILSKTETANTTRLEFNHQETLDFDKKGSKAWTYDGNTVAKDSTGNRYFVMSGEWGPTFSQEMVLLSPRSNQFIDIAVDLKLQDTILQPIKGLLVAEFINEADSVVLWKGMSIDGQTQATANWQRVYASIRLAHEPIYPNTQPLRLRCFFWNRAKQALHLDRFSVSSRKGNQILYGDTRNLKSH